LVGCGGRRAHDVDPSVLERGFGHRDDRVPVVRSSAVAELRLQTVLGGDRSLNEAFLAWPLVFACPRVRA